LNVCSRCGLSADETSALPEARGAAAQDIDKMKFVGQNP
jgi:hypothetical protein